MRKCFLHHSNIFIISEIVKKTDAFLSLQNQKREKLSFLGFENISISKLQMHYNSLLCMKAWISGATPTNHFPSICNFFHSHREERCHCLIYRIVQDFAWILQKEKNLPNLDIALKTRFFLFSNGIIQRKVMLSKYLIFELPHVILELTPTPTFLILSIQNV